MQVAKAGLEVLAATACGLHQMANQSRHLARHGQASARQQDRLPDQMLLSNSFLETIIGTRPTRLEGPAGLDGLQRVAGSAPLQDAPSA